MRIVFPGVWWNDLNKADESDFFVFVENHEGRQVCYVGNEALEKVETAILNTCIDLRMLKLEVLIESSQQSA